MILLFGRKNSSVSLRLVLYSVILFKSKACLDEGSSYNLTIPQDVVNGEYLIRHEIIALQQAGVMGGAQFYPSCSQVRVRLGVTDRCPSPTVHFPGAYQDDNPGLYDTNVSSQSVLH